MFLLNFSNTLGYILYSQNKDLISLIIVSKSLHKNRACAIRNAASRVNMLPLLFIFALMATNDIVCMVDHTSKVNKLLYLFPSLSRSLVSYQKTDARLKCATLMAN